MKAISIYPDAQGRAQLEQALSAHTDVHLCRSFDRVPDTDTLARAIRAWAPGVLFLDLTAPSTEAVNAFLAKEFPELRRVAIHSSQVPDVFRRVLHLGMHELINPPFRTAAFDPVMNRLKQHLEQNPVSLKRTCQSWAFLPAKAGVGASTAAAHITWAAAADPSARILLADFDRHSGITAFQFNVNPEYTLQDALLNSLELDEDSWNRLVVRKNNIELLLSRPGLVSDVNLDRFTRDLLQFAQRNYTAIHLDLPDTLDPQTLAVLHESDQIFLVTTADLASLRLAKLKLDTLRKLDLENRTRLILSRASAKLLLSASDIRDAVGMEVFASFPCDYAGVSESLRTARPNPRMLKAAESLLHGAGQVTAPRRKSFLDKLGMPLSYLRAQPETSQLLRP